MVAWFTVGVQATVEDDRAVSLLFPHSRIRKRGNDKETTSLVVSL